VLRPLVQSIQDLAERQRQLVIDSSEDRRHEQDLQQQKQEYTARGNCQEEREFRRKGELSDLARNYRKLNAELDLSKVLGCRSFFINEGRLLKNEIRQLVDLHICQQNPNDEHSRTVEIPATSH
jgi:hypothetical protein